MQRLRGGNEAASKEIVDSVSAAHFRQTATVLEGSPEDASRWKDDRQNEQ
jgi:hypothetical protein